MRLSKPCIARLERGMHSHRLRSLMTALLVFVGFVVACGETHEPMADPPSATATLTPTRPPVEPVALHETPVPMPVSESALADIRARGELNVGILYNYPPFSYLAGNGEAQGYEVELLRLLAERWGIGVKFLQVTRQTRLPLLYGGEVDLVAGAVPHRREMEQFGEFSASTFRSGYIVAALKTTGIDSIAEGGGLPTGAIGQDAQAVFAQYTSQIGLAPAITVYETPDDAIQAFAAGDNISIIVGRREDVMRVAISVDDLQILDEFILTEPYAFLVRRGDTAFRDLIDLTLQDISHSGDLSRLFSAHFYGYPADLFPTMEGEAVYTFETMPTRYPVADSLVERIRRGEALRVAGMDLSDQPAAFDGQPIVDGYNRAVVNELARRWNMPIVEIPGSAGETGVSLLQAGQADLVVGVRPNRSAVGQLAFSQAYYQRGLRLIHMDDVPVLDINDLEFKPTLAVPPTDISQDIVQDNNRIPRVETSESYDAAFHELIGHVAYAIVGDEFSLVLMSQADTRIEVIDRVYRPANYVMALPFYDADFLSLVDFTLQDMKADGTLDALRQQYFGPYVTDDDPLEPFPMEIWPGDGSYLGIGR